MNFDYCTTFSTKNPVYYVATMDGDQPRFRAFLLWFADATWFFFHTTAQKNVVAQLLINPNAEICFTAPPRPPDPVEMLRVTGSMVRVYDADHYLDTAARSDRREWLSDRLRLSGHHAE
jgi:pyridoxamine 5'-phosphate oxidase